MTKVFINANEIEYSINKVKRYLDKEEVLLTKIRSSLLNNFDNYYTSYNMSKMHAACSSLGYYNSILIDSRRKYILTLNNVISKYKLTTKQAERMLERSQREIKNNANRK
ncbi:MAG: hypothetical protein IKO49_04905 [Bacilli bacterium]|nr:hypothetical protein [Bacilli bacterium]